MTTGTKPATRAGGQGLSLHQLRIFCAVAQAQTLTRASKQLGLAQPSISQQLAKLEQVAGVRLFDRGATRMVLTDAGQFLLRHAMQILNAVDETEAGLRAMGDGTRGIVRIAGLNSVLRLLLPPAMATLETTRPGVEVHVHEVPPAETLDLLYSRRVTVGLIAANSVSESSVGFRQVPVVDDPYVLVTPAWLDLSEMADPAGAPEAERAVLNSCIQFNFGTQHTLRVEQWYNEVLPGHRLIARCRTYEIAVQMVRAGLGVCLAPALAALDTTGEPTGVRLWASGQPDRRTVALFPAQYTRVEPVRSFIAALETAGKAVSLPPIGPVPPFVRAAMQARAGAMHP